MKWVKTAAIYSIFIGISMIGLWTMLFLSGGIPELNTTPVAISMHIAAEMLTAILLIIGGIGLLAKKIWAFQTYMFSMGMLIYTYIQSPGYYLEKGEMSIVAMFAVFMAIALFFVVMSFLKRTLFQAK